MPDTPFEPEPWPQLAGVGPVEVDDATVLRGWTPSDAAALAGAWADAELKRWLDPPTPTLETAQRWISGAEDRARTGAALDLVIDHRGVVAGEVGLSGFDASRRACLVGYWLGARHRGAGLAAAAVRRAADFARDVLGVRTLVAECHPANVASHATAERAGFSLLAEDHNGSRIYALR